LAPVHPCNNENMTQRHPTPITLQRFNTLKS
jgi:hypothetical protein